MGRWLHFVQRSVICKRCLLVAFGMRDISNGFQGVIVQVWDSLEALLTTCSGYFNDKQSAEVQAAHSLTMLFLAGLTGSMPAACSACSMRAFYA